jgi:hypothetical protein
MSASSQNATAAGGIFGAAAKDKKPDEPKPKRTMLKNVDTVAVKCLDPYGLSIIDDVPSKSLWKLVQKGDKWAMFFNELAADESNCKDPVKRVGIGVSRYAETYANAIKEWQGHEDLRKMLLPKVVKKVDDEARELLPHLERINAGKTGYQTDKYDTFKSFKEDKRRKVEGGTSKPMPNNGELEESVAALWKFLELGTNSNLRAVFSCLSTGGVFYSASVLDKTTRAWMQHKSPKPTQETVLTCIKERHSCTKTEGDTEAMEFKRERVTGNLFDD